MNCSYRIPRNVRAIDFNVEYRHQFIQELTYDCSSHIEMRSKNPRITAYNNIRFAIGFVLNRDIEAPEATNSAKHATTRCKRAQNPRRQVLHMFFSSKSMS